MEDSKIIRSEELDNIENLDDKVKNMRFDNSRYAILMETDPVQFESWYYFIKYEGNEDNLQDLKRQLDQIDMHVLDDYHTFDIDIEKLVSGTTAKEMTKVELNHYTFHRKFDGKLDKINLRLKTSDSTERKLKKCNHKLRDMKIEEYIEDEDVSLVEDESDNEEDSESLTSSDTENTKKIDNNRRPPVITKNLPRFALKKRRKNR